MCHRLGQWCNVARNVLCRIFGTNRDASRGLVTRLDKVKAAAKQGQRPSFELCYKLNFSAALRPTPLTSLARKMKLALLITLLFASSVIAQGPGIFDSDGHVKSVPVARDVNPEFAARSPTSKRETNAARMRRGLGPLPPTRRASGQCTFIIVITNLY
jgi:hypothetical protein